MEDLPQLTGKENECLMLWLMNGHNKSAAYRGAYDCSNMSDTSINVEACRFFKNPKITLWIDYYRKNTQQTLQEQLDYDAMTHFNELNEMKNKALKCRDKYNNPNISTALKAVELKGKLAGLYNESKNEDAESSSVNIMPTIIVDGKKVDYKVGEKIKDNSQSEVDDENSTSKDT